METRGRREVQGGPPKIKKSKKGSFVPYYYYSAKLEFYVSLVDADPKALVTSDAEGLTPLQRARVRREGEDIVRFLEEKTDTAKKVSDAFPGIGQEEFARKFKMWEAL